MTEKLKVLFLTANPVLSARLRTDEDYRRIAEAVQSGLDRDLYELVPLLAARADDLQRALRKHQPQVVHFSGHADEHGLVLEDEAGRPMRVSGEALAGLFQILAGTIRLVVLSACHSRSTAEAFRMFVDYTIAMRRRITDRAAIKFSAAFYAALADGEAVPVAFDYGVQALRYEHAEEVDIPELLRRPGVSDAAMAVKRASVSEPRGAQPQQGVVVDVKGTVGGSVTAINGNNNVVNGR